MSAAVKCRQKCPTPFCRNFLPDRTKSRKTLCHKCAQRRWRAAQKVSAAYAQQRDHARQRGLSFTITRVQFECFAKLSGLLDGPRSHREGITIDRIDNTKGYEPGNIQPMTRAENASKRWKSDERRMTAGYAKRHYAGMFVEGCDDEPESFLL